jgi:hypothetical protein
MRLKYDKVSGEQRDAAATSSELFAMSFSVL